MVQTICNLLTPLKAVIDKNSFRNYLKEKAEYFIRIIFDHISLMIKQKLLQQCWEAFTPPPELIDDSTCYINIKMEKSIRFI